MRLRWVGVSVLFILSCERFSFHPPPPSVLPRPPENVSGKVLLSSDMGGNDPAIFLLGAGSGVIEEVVDIHGYDDVWPAAMEGGVIFSSNVHGDYGILLYDGDTSTLYDDPSDQIWPSVSPSGRYVAFVTFRDDPGGNLGIYDLLDRYTQVWYDTLPISWVSFVNDTLILAVRGNSVQTFSLRSLTWRVVFSGGTVYSPKVSPDGRTLAYVEVGDSFRIVVVSYPNVGNRKVLGAYVDSVRGLAWSPDGRFLAFGYGRGVYLLDTLANIYILKDSVGRAYVGDWVR